jgi:uncharacterized protein (TIGR03437 family)
MRNKALVVWMALLSLVCSCSLHAAVGNLRYFPLAGPEWDPFTSSPDPAMHAFIRDHLSRIGTFSPFFDKKLQWMPDALVYFDAYAIYPNTKVARQHPEWILKDSSGNKLFIPYNCAKGTCPQYAGDISNPDFREWQIDQIRQTLATGYKGIWLDDVNLSFTVSNGTAALVAPLDALTDLPMLAGDWERYFVEYLEQIRSELPDIEILHNSVWYAAGGVNDPLVARQVAAANYINLERGFGDSGLIGGTARLSLSSLMKYIDFVHSIGTPIVVEDYFLVDRSYSLAAYYLVQSDNDGFGIREQTPANWPDHLYDVQLGPAASPRYKWNGLWRRDFAGGMALVNEPGAPKRTATLPFGMMDADGNPTPTVTLSAKQGGIFLYAAPPPVFLTLDGIQSVALDLKGKLVASGNAASVGDYIALYCTGLGDVEPPVAPGDITPLSPLSYTVNTVTVTIGAVDARVIFAGLAPGLAGLYQVNVQVPVGAARGDFVPILVGSGGLTSMPATIALH